VLFEHKAETTVTGITAEPWGGVFWVPSTKGKPSNVAGRSAATSSAAAAAAAV
jgi:hypothetical protein